MKLPSFSQHTIPDQAFAYSHVFSEHPLCPGRMLGITV